MALKYQLFLFSVFNLTLLLYFTNWFILYCSTRTLSNTLECCISLIALNWYESNRHANAKQNHDGFGISAFLATLTTILRPTAVLLWAPLFLSYLIEHSRTKTNSFDFYKGMRNLLG
jgi:phosphatidylinositol glycan class B